MDFTNFFGATCKCFTIIFVTLFYTSCSQVNTKKPGESLFPSTKEVSSLNDFAQVCNGIALGAAPTYAKESGIHPILIFEQKDQQSPFEQNFGNFPKSWQVDENNAKDNQLVACIKITKQELKKKCDGYETSGKAGNEKNYIVELYNANYEVTLYEAKTAEKITSKNFNLEAKECPIITSFNSNDLVSKEYPDFEQVVINFVKPYVQF